MIIRLLRNITNLILVGVFLIGCSGTQQVTSITSLPIIETTIPSPFPTSTDIPKTQPTPTNIPTKEPTSLPSGTVVPEISPTPAQPAGPTPKPPALTPTIPKKILFIGNSSTYWNKGLDFLFEELAGSANLSQVIEADAVTVPAAPLSSLWEYSNAREVIGTGAYDVVVLQEDLPVTDVNTFHEYARKFDAEIKEVDSALVLLMAWPYERIGSVTTEDIDQAHRTIQTELGIAIAPVALAWQRAMEERPDLDMYRPDREHPSIFGSYLAVNVVFATVLVESPIGLTYLPSERGGVTEEEAAFLQRIAWETVQDYYGLE